MSEQMSKLQAWIAGWPDVRREMESMIETHAKNDPSLHFELTLAQLELKEIDDSMRRIYALGQLLNSEDLGAAERQATGNY